MELSLRPPHQDVRAVRSGHRALDHQHVVLGHDVDHFQIAHRHARVAHVAAHAHTGNHTRGKARGSNRSGSAMEHRTVRAFAAAEMMPLHYARKTAALAHANHVDLVLGLELIHQHLVAGLGIAIARTQRELPQVAHASHPGLLEVARFRLVDALFLDVLHQAKLHRIIAVGSGRLALHYHARTSLQQGDRDYLSIRPEDLGHADFFAKNTCAHISKSFCNSKTPRLSPRLSVSASIFSYFPNALISTSTPAGRSSFISASTVCCVGSRISSNRLWVRISNCSRDFLSTCGDRSTQYLFFIVGSGIGPAICAPVRFAVSTISPVD